MLKRIIMLEENEAMERLAVETARDHEGVEILHMEPAARQPANAVAVLGGGDPGVALGLALHMAEGMEELLEWLGSAIDATEYYPAGASRRLREHATRFSAALGLNADGQFAFEKSAYVRNIGNLFIQPELLTKKSVLSYEEWGMLQQHANLGADVVRGLHLLADTELIVRHHHECFDGSGYPNGLTGGGIPLLARAMKIIDVYCAMTSPRHYRPGYTRHDDAMDFIHEESGKYFDPGMVEVFVKARVGHPLEADA